MTSPTKHPDNACTKTSSTGKVCHVHAGHEGLMHIDLTGGGMVMWMEPAPEWSNQPSVPADPERDAPEALRTGPTVTMGITASDAPSPQLPGLPPGVEGLNA